MGAEAIAHRLHQVLGQAARGVAADVVERAAVAGNGNASQGGTGDNLAQAGQTAVDLLREPWIHHQVRQLLISGVSVLDALQQAGANDAASLPDLADSGKIEVVVMQG